MTDIKQNKIKVFIVDDHQAVREGLRSYLTRHLLAVVGEASDAPEAIRKAKKLAPDIIILDVNLPSMNGWEAARSLRRLVPRSRIIAFSIHSSEEYVARMARSGARGYVMKSQPTGELLEAIRQVFQGGRYFPAGMNDSSFAKGHKPSAKKSPPENPGRKPSLSTRRKGGLIKKTPQKT